MHTHTEAYPRYFEEGSKSIIELTKVGVWVQLSLPKEFQYFTQKIAIFSTKIYSMYNIELEP